MAEVKSYKVLSLPSRPSPDSIYWVKSSSASDVIGFITDRNGVPYPLKDLQGSGGITTLTNTDGNLVITGADDKVINLAPTLLSVINSALQSGDNISELLNDAGYITSADLPTKTSELVNDGSDATSTYVEADELGAVAFSNDYNDLDNKPTIPTVITNHSGLSLDDGTNPHGTTKSDVGLGSVDNTSDVDKPISTATQNALDLKLDKVTTAGVERVYTINADGSQGTKPTSDFKDVIEGYFNGTNFYTDSGFTNLITPESGKIYLNIAVTPATQYRWSGSAYSQIGGGVVPNAIGDIYNKNTWDNTSDFTTFGDATVSLSGSYINIGSATNGSFNNYIKFSRVTNLNKYRMVIEFKIINAPSATTYGLGLGLRSLNSRPFDSYHYVATIGLPSTTTNKRIYVYTGITTYTLRLTSGTDAVFALNDIIRLTVEQDVNVITCNFLNLTTGNTQVSTYTFPMGSPFLPNTGNFVINMLGGTYEMRKLAVESKDYENAKLICVGDSKTAGYFADSFSTSFGNQLVNYSKGVSVNAGGSDKTAEVLLKVPELIALKPKRVLLNIGSNDKRYGITYATWQANYDSIVSQLEAEGIEVYHLLQLNESVLTFTDYNSHITSTYDSSKIIDAGVVSLNADGIHPNQQAMNHIFYTVLSKIKLD